MLALAEAELRLQALLQPLAPLWRSSPFAGAEAAAGGAQAALPYDLVDGLDDDTVDRLGSAVDEGMALRARLGERVSALTEVDALLQQLLGEAPPATPAPAVDSPHCRRDVGGRKLAQIDAFLQAVGPIDRPLVDWCAGKGHLGRLASLRDGVAATCVERDAALCADGEGLARRDRASVDFLRADAMAIDLEQRFAGRHLLALHACGHLHRRLVREAAASGLEALDLAPCCHHRSVGEAEAGGTHGVAPLLTADERRLAVTGHATASHREWQRHRRLLGWQCALRELRRRCGEGPDEGLPAQQEGARAASFGAWAEQWARRGSRVLPAAAALEHLEAQGHAEASRLLRRSLLRLAFQRPLEVWLVLRLALALEAQGFAVRLRRFCDARLTPRNLLLSARRGAGVIPVHVGAAL